MTENIPLAHMTRTNNVAQFQTLEQESERLIVPRVAINLLSYKYRNRSCFKDARHVGSSATYMKGPMILKYDILMLMQFVSH